jgi:hypothetical protein
VGSFEQSLKAEFGKDIHDLGGEPSLVMHRALDRIRRNNLWAFKVYLFLIIFILVAFVILTGYFVSRPQDLAVAAGAVGLSLWKPFEFVLKAWEGWRKSELMMVLIEGAGSNEIQLMFDKIVEKY